jgi:hypothetical protein
MAEHVIALDVAEKQLQEMEDEFGALGQHRSVVLDAIMRGLVDYESGSDCVTYRLEKPVGSIDMITLHEPDVSEIKRISKGFVANADSKGNVTIDVGQSEEQMVRLISLLGGVAVGEVNKIKRRDWAVLTGIAGFFG